ncbi:MAG TPA: beta-L-arabinofuranosidase domain-containing protein [Tepidisphaeraceae bacterium]|jgi:hypothetical protein|nr:beta-L-arabinofuranosidase domain-containing protein [Tepidisphaeraceae bacterium]
MNRFCRLILVSILLAISQQQPSPAASPPDQAPPKFDRPSNLSINLGGRVRDYVNAVTDNWFLRAPADNPAILAMFRDRDKQPYRDFLPWSGEFAGKYLTAGAQVLRLTGDNRLRAHLQKFVDELVTLQDTDGYLGPFPKDSHLTGKAPNCGGGTWDAWGHYHIMLGLLLWHESTGDAKALLCARRIGDLLCEKFLGPDKRILDTGSAEMNHAPIHTLALLYRKTGEKRYLDLAQEIVEEFSLPGAGDYLRVALAGKSFYQTPKPRWESLHPIMGLIEMHRITGNADYRRAFEQLWWSIAEYDRHNNGGFSSGEQAQGNPYHGGAIETCCTIAWMAMSVEMLATTGESIIADELELSTLNQVLALHSPTGQWCTYNTPMDGVRKPSTIDIAFQKRVGSEQLNCCSVNAARGFGMISDWALMQENENTLILNWYGPSTLTANVAGTSVKLEQETAYPLEPRIVVKVSPEKPADFTLKFRIPHWSSATGFLLNWRPLMTEKIKPGAYYTIQRHWKAGDQITIDLDFTPHIWSGEKECAGKSSIYRGPILLAYDIGKGSELPKIDARQLPKAKPSLTSGPWLAMQVNTTDGQAVNLIDYASAGANGRPYASWLPLQNTPSTPFSRTTPLRSGHAK